MIWLFYSLALVVSVGFAFFVPAFFRWIATLNESFGFPEMKQYLPRIFRIFSWIVLVAIGINVCWLPFISVSEQMAEAVIGIVAGCVLAWRFRLAGKAGAQPK